MRSVPQKQQLSAFIVDDEQASLEVLANDLKQMPQIAAVHTFSSYSEATLPLIELQPDVVFLDVEVPGKADLTFSNLSGSAFPFIFTPFSTLATATTCSRPYASRHPTSC